MINIHALRLRRGAWFVFPVIILIALGAPWVRGRVLVPADILGTIDTTHLERPMANPLLSDVVTQFYPWQQFLFDRLEAGEWPLWNPYILAGTPFMANDQSAIFDPIRLFTYVMGISAANGMWVIAAIRLLLIGLFTWLWIRGRGVSSGVALTAGAVAMTASSSVAWVAYPLFAAVVWLPLMLYAVERVGQNPRRAWTVLTVAIAAQSISGNIQISAFSLAVILAWTLVQQVKSRKGQLTLVMTSILIGVAIAAIQLLPTASFIQQSVQHDTGRHGYASTSIWQAIRGGKWFGWKSVGDAQQNVATLLPVVVPNAFGNPAHGAYRFIGNNLSNNANELAGSIGIVGLLFAVIGAWVFRRERAVRAILAGLTVSIGMIIHAPIFELLNYLPFINQTNTGRLRFVVVFGLIALAAYGYRAWQEKKISRRVWTSLAVALWAISIAVLWFAPRTPWRIVDLITVTVALGGAIGLQFWRINQRWSESIIGVLVIFPLLITMWGYNSSSPRAELVIDQKVLTTLQTTLGHSYRLAAISHQQSVPVVPNTGMRNELYDVRGYEVVRLSSFDLIARDVFAEPKSNLRTISGYSAALDLLAVKVVLVPTDDLAWVADDFIEHGWVLSELTEQVTMFTNPNVRSRAYVAGTVKTVSPEAPAASTLQSALGDLGTTYIATSATAIPTRRLIADAVVAEETANTVTITTSMPADGYLVLADTYAPGWRAFVDGQPSDVLKANGWSRAVAVPAGTHEVRFVYKPTAVIVGLWMSLLGLVIGFVVWLGWSRMKYPLSPREPN